MHSQNPSTSSRSISLLLCLGVAILVAAHLMNSHPPAEKPVQQETQRTAVTPEIEVRSALNSDDITAALAQLDASQMEAAAAMAVQFGIYEPEGQKFMVALMRRWGELDANAALHYAMKVGGEWAGPAALQVLATAPEFDSAWLAYAQRFAEHDAAAYLKTLWEGLDGSTTATWTAWVTALPAGETKRAATEALVTRWAVSEPTAAARWLLQQDPAGSMEQAYLHLGRQWAAQDPKAALSWAESLQHNTAQVFAQKAIVSAWSNAAPSKAYQHISSLPKNSTTDGYRYWFVEGAREAAPMLAESVRLQISDTELRAQASSQGAQ
jgi:hypothetical protein